VTFESEEESGKGVAHISRVERIQLLRLAAVEVSFAQVGDEYVTRYWALRRGDDQDTSMTCDLFSTGKGLEARCYCGKDLVRAEHLSSIADAMNLCAAWKAAYHLQGWIELSP